MFILSQNIMRLSEMLILFFLLPLLLMLNLLPVHMMVVLFGTFAGVLIYFMRCEKEYFYALFKLPPRDELLFALKRFTLLLLVLLLLTLLLYPDKFLSFVANRPLLWGMVMILYPLFSVLPQEIIYRAFFYKRYRTLFTSETSWIVINAFAFGFMHLIFLNAVAPTLTLLGGFIFAKTFIKSHNILSVSFEHALYGCAIFTLGIGEFFYHGAIGR